MIPSTLRHPAPEPTGGETDGFARAHAVCVEKIRRNIVTLADEPKSGAFDKHGDYFAFDEGFFDIGNWTSSFFTGMALLAFQTTKDPGFLQQTGRLADAYRDKVCKHGTDTMHDLGFLYSLYSVGLYKLTGSADHRSTALKAADELAQRFVPAGGYIRAWGRMDETDTEYAGLAIIDCMMNLPLLFWAALETGSKSYYQIALRHADTTAAWFVRADDSVFHAYRFDPATGAPTRPDNYCGYSVHSHWARGASWAIYGFALAHRYTRKEAYLAVSRRVARRFLGLLDDELVPQWDFCLPPGASPLRDSSAAAIAACGLYELARISPGDADLSRAADALLARLCKPDYLDDRPDCRGVLKKGQVGNGVGKARSCYTSWGDYFFMQALAMRLHALRGDW